MGNLTTTAIITKGLHCGPACKGIITSYFSLVCKDVPIPPTGGGPYPRGGGAWNQIDDIQNFYRPVEEQPFLVPRDKEAEYFRKYKIVQLMVKLGEKTVTKEYRVPENKARVIINVINLVNATIDRITVAISGLKRITSGIIVMVKNLKKRM